MSIREEKIWELFEVALDAITIPREIAEEISHALNTLQGKTEEATRT